ncbi:MAG: peptidyl-prolyl cis-trans isomerase [Bacteroidetes bacterium]|nr:peptidyl-prolyl cis-trans isomerase [Bacteroidota bacterium]
MSRIGLIILIIFQSCDLIPLNGVKESTDTAIPVARVRDTFLYKDDLNGMVPDDVSSEDSIQITNQYIDDWIKKQLMIDRASASMELNEADLERRVLDYRYALIVHEYEKLLINQDLNREVTDEEISQYYEEKRDNFILRQNIIKGLFAKLPKEVPRITNIRNQFRSYPNSDIEEMRSYCYQFASLTHLEDSLWVNFNEVIKNTPLASVPNKVQFLRNNNFIETSDDEFVYLLRILDFKISEQNSPLEYVRDDIVNIIINKRKIDLTRQLEDQTIQAALKRKDFEKYEIN